MLYDFTILKENFYFECWKMIFPLCLRLEACANDVRSNFPPKSIIFERAEKKTQKSAAKKFGILKFNYFKPHKRISFDQ
jgi:hypothetical protein